MYYRILEELYVKRTLARHSKFRELLESRSLVDRLSRNFGNIESVLEKI
jgi:hypothetical protein